MNAEIKIYESEDEVLADLIETNIRQRGIGNPNPVKLGRCIKELERIYGIQNGNNQHDRLPKVSEGSIDTQTQLADMIGISVDTLSNYKKLTEMIPELEDTCCWEIYNGWSESEGTYLTISFTSQCRIRHKSLRVLVDTSLLCLSRWSVL